MMSLKKIVLKNTTALSLNDRFTYLRQHTDRVADVAAGPSARIDRMRQARAQLQRASAKNRRLALQMENRPAVAAALRIKKRNMRQRVGLTPGQQQQNSQFGSIRDRLTLSTRSRLNWRGRGRAANNGGMRSAAMPQNLRARGARLGFNRPQRIPQRASPGNNFRARGGLNRQRGGMRGIAGGMRGIAGGARGAANFFSPRGRGVSPVRNFASGFNNNRRGNQRGFLNRQQPRGGQRGRGQGRGGRGQMRGRVQQRGGRGRGGRGQKQTVPTRDELDNQLDEYMAGTKAQLDKDLDQYMNVQI